MSESDGKVNAAYRSLAREEPPASLDAAILAASRKALVRPSASRRWAAPVSIAAVLVLAVGVSLRMQLEKPGIESPDMDSVRREAPPPPAMKPQAAEERPAEREAPKVAVPQRAVPRHDAPKPALQQSAPVPEKKVVVTQSKPDVAEPDRAFRDEARAQDERKDLKDMKEETASRAKLAKESNVTSLAAGAAAPPAAPPAMKREAFAAAAPAAAPAAAAADAQAIDEPTRELEAIAKLRAENRAEEADKALAEFRRKRPDYRIPEAMWERVKPR